MGSNIKKTKMNAVVLLISQVVTIAFGLIMPRITILGYGSEVNGLINSVTQIVAYLILFEAGIQAVAKQALYKTVAGGDQQGTNSILSAVHINYKRIGTLYLLGLLLLAGVYPLLTTSETLDYFTIFAVVFFSGFANVVSFFFQGKYQILLAVDGKSYVLTTISTVISIVNHIVKILLLSCGVNILIVVFATALISLSQVIAVLTYVKRHYSWVNVKEKPNHSSLNQSKYAFIQQVTAQVFAHTDVLLLTIFSGLKIVSVYSLYKMIVHYIRTILVIPLDSAAFALGQLFNTDRKRYVEVYDAFELVLSTAVFSVFAVTSFLIRPFLRLYTAGITDVNYIYTFLPMLFTLGEILSVIRTPLNGTINFAGHFRQTVGRSILEMVLNVIVSLVGVVFYGIYGVLFGTIVALLYRTTDVILYANKHVFERKPWKTLSVHAINLAMYFGVLFLLENVGIRISSYFDFVLSGIVITPTVVTLFFAVMFFLYRKERTIVMEFVRGSVGISKKSLK